MDSRRLGLVMGASALAFFGLGIAACERHQGPAEKAGEQVDRAVDRAGENVDRAGDRLRERADDARDRLGGDSSNDSQTAPPAGGNGNP